MKRYSLAAALTLMVCLIMQSAPGLSQTVDSKMLGHVDMAKEFAEKGELLKALEALEAAKHDLWQAVPLSFPVVEQVVSSNEDGAHEKRSNTVYRPGDALTVYVEPIGYGHEDLDGRFRIAMKADLAIETLSGQVLVESKDIFSLSTDGRRQHKEFDMVLSFILPDLTPGAYLAAFNINDTASGKTGSFSTEFTIEADPNAPTDENSTNSQ